MPVGDEFLRRCRGKVKNLPSGGKERLKAMLAKNGDLVKNNRRIGERDKG